MGEVYGPFATRRDIPGNRLYKEMWKSFPKGYKPLPYIFQQFLGSSTINGQTLVYDLPDNAVAHNSTGGNLPDSLFESMYAVAYGKLVSRAHGKTRASLGTALAEIQKSSVMISKRLTQLHDFGEALQKRDFGGVVRALGFAQNSRMRVGRRTHRMLREEQTIRLKTVWDRQALRPRSFANNYLELVFGWAPIVSDIGNALVVLSRPFPSYPVKGYEERVDNWVTNSFMIWNVRPESTTVYTSKAKLLLQTTVRVDSPNVTLANELGLVNLAQVAWQVTPYSFLIDSMIPVAKYLGAYTDWAGLRLEDPFQTRVFESESKRVDNYWGMAGRGIETYNAWGVHARRELRSQSFQVPTLRSLIQLPGGDLIGRAASTAALLVQQLSNKQGR